ncbi:ketopantoate reductase family protein [Gephyromycinifex aptenodytis]|uniref:ketopantoate reductase family protein n=1 Tax=Gephyromycinifex aptenodytis TaxID=2716227 RepID=UPI00144806C5|nr:2-dehydropantoate 2-reductase [Gephyromycinifex aptenodytis]
MSSQQIENVAIVGAGAMGAMYAAHFAAAGMPVTLVAGGERAQRLRRNGLTINGEPLRAEVFDAESPGAAEQATADLVIIAVKNSQLNAAIADVRPLVAAHTTFISVLNGLDSEARIAQKFDPDQVLLCVALAMDARREGNRVSYRQSGRLALGSATPGGQGQRLRELTCALDRAGLAWQAPEDMRHMMWWKFMVNVGVNQASALTRTPYGAFVPAGPCRELMESLMSEVVAVARAEEVELGRSDLDTWESVLSAQPAEGWTSMLQDVVAGRPSEVDIFAGRVVELGARHGIATPYNETALRVLRGLGYAVA